MGYLDGIEPENRFDEWEVESNIEPNENNNIASDSTPSYESTEAQDDRNYADAQIGGSAGGTDFVGVLNDNPTGLNNNAAPQSPQIPKDNAPFIVLCGPPASGKSMVLKSLASYLYTNPSLGYSIKANTTLLNTVKYQNDCADFDQIIGQPNIKMPNTVDYLLADIFDGNGNIKAHFLEAPGEHFFHLSDVKNEPNLPFEGYLANVVQATSNTKRKVVYIILLDLDSPTSFRNNSTLRQKYTDKMIKLYNSYVKHHPSRVILLYNKVDLPMNGTWANSGGCGNPKAVLADARRNYANLFFKEKFIFWDVECIDFLPYCTGSYDSGNAFTPSGDVYPKNLWECINKRLF